jgi:hypothetical protein
VIAEMKEVIEQLLRMHGLLERGSTSAFRVATAIDELEHAIIEYERENKPE